MAQRSDCPWSFSMTVDGRQFNQQSPNSKFLIHRAWRRKGMKSYGMGDLLPVIFLIDRTGKIRTAKVGFGDKVEFEKTIEQLLHEK
jgi:peroxiredoxin